MLDQISLLGLAGISHGFRLQQLFSKHASHDCLTPGDVYMITNNLVTQDSQLEKNTAHPHCMQ